MKFAEKKFFGPYLPLARTNLPTIYMFYTRHSVLVSMLLSQYNLVIGLYDRAR